MLQELEGTATVTGPAAKDEDKWPVSNLITRLNNRSGGNELPPITDGNGSSASYQTCFKTTNVQLASQGNMFVLSFNLGSSFFQHCILVVADLYTGWRPYEHTDTNQWLQNYEIYIGDDPSYANNPKCPGGPFMRTADTKNYTSITWSASGGGTADMWNYGKEHWCNM